MPRRPKTTSDQDTILTVSQTEDGRLDISPATPDVQTAPDQLSDGIVFDPALFGDTIRGYSVTFKEGHAEGSEGLQVGQGILNKNTLIYVGSIVVSRMAGGPLSALGNDLFA